jgi:hypothetical protein
MCLDHSLAIPIIAASSALAGVLVSQVSAIMLAGRAREHQRKILLREKYEELAILLVDSLESYLSLLSSSTSQELLLHTRHAHAQKTDVLARLYFPELKQLTSNYLFSLVSFQNSLAKNYNPELEESAGVQGANSVAVNTAQQKLELAKNLLEAVIEKHATKYAIA